MKKRIIRGVAVSIALVATASALSACSAGAASDDGKTITVYGWKGSETEPANVPEINAAFEKANPGVTVKFEFLGAGDVINQRLQPELLAGTGPDVFMADGASLRAAEENGYLADLTDQDWASTLSPQVAPYVTVDEKVYGAPLELVPLGLYANMDILAEAGITEFPTTHDEFVADLKALQSAGLPGLAVPDKGTWTDAAIVNAAASTLVYADNPDWDERFMAGDADFGDWKSSVEQLTALDSAGYVDLAAGLGVDEWSQGLEDFKAGKSTFLYQGGWNLVDFQKAVPSVQLGVWPASNDGAQHATLFSGINWVVNEASEHQDLAKEYIDFFVSSENLAGFLEAESAYSPYVDGESPSNPAAATIEQAVADGDYRLDATLTWESADNQTTFGQDIQSIALGETTVDDALKKWNAFRD